ncbi:DUF1326 domain-containing protein [Streptomyces sp. NPDC001401]|uniref:DUF1326 domain-containing protein n=1 Tax=Streptomyces sp. NPDC001401 TaxID=3364570 RepID=UPI0036BD798C
MGWSLEGRYFEACPCDVVCPCTVSALAMPADTERCQVTLVFHVDRGDVEGVDVGGLTVALLADAPGQMSLGGWRVGLFLDEAASAEQAEKLQAVFSGAMGGPPEVLTPLVGEIVGVETAPITFDSEGRIHRVTIGDSVDIEVEDFFHEGASEGATLHGMTITPNPVVTIAKSNVARIRAFGLDLDLAGRNGHSAPFAWSV